jgi:hypothetical protein
MNTNQKVAGSSPAERAKESPVNGEVSSLLRVPHAGAFGLSDRSLKRERCKSARHDIKVEQSLPD